MVCELASGTLWPGLDKITNCELGQTEVRNRKYWNTEPEVGEELAEISGLQLLVLLAAYLLPLEFVEKSWYKDFIMLKWTIAPDSNWPESSIHGCWEKVLSYLSSQLCGPWQVYKNIELDSGMYCVQCTSVPLLSHINRFTITPITFQPSLKCPSADYSHPYTNNFGNTWDD